MRLRDVETILVMKTTLRFLRICRIFPKDEDLDNPENHQKWSLIMLLFCAYFPVGILLQIIRSMKYGGNYYLDREIMILLSYAGTGYFTISYVLHIKKVITICKRLSDFESFGKPTEFDRTDNLLNRCSLLHFYYHLAIVCVISLSESVNIGKCRKVNEEIEVQEICGMIGRMWLPFNYDYFPLKQIIFAYQLFVSFVSYHAAGVISYNILEIVEQLSVRFHHIVERFTEVLATVDPVERRKQFNKTIQYHYSLIEMGKILNVTFSGGFMVHIILTAPVIGVCGFRILSEMPLDAILLLLSWSISTVLACLGGQRLQDSSELLGEVLNQTQWYDLDDELKKDLILVTIRARQTISLNAGPFATVTNTMILAFGKAAYSYVTLLNNTM